MTAWEDANKLLVLSIVVPISIVLIFHRLGWRRYSVGRAWNLRILIYGLMALFVAPALLSYLAFNRDINDPELLCMDDVKACLNGGSQPGNSPGLLKSTEGRSTESTIPCSHVGVWSSRRGNQMHRITLKDDGTYRMEANESGAGGHAGYTGHWAVQGQAMVWRHNEAPGVGLDVNPMRQIDSDHFILTEENGMSTKYELIRRVPSTTCKP